MYAILNYHTDAMMNIDGFKLLRGDRTECAGKEIGGGVCAYVNEKWCHPNNVTVKNHSCNQNIEILTINLRPYYLPREFSHVILLTVYIPHRNVDKPTALELVNVIHDLETKSPDALFLVNGDFNYSSLRKSSLQYYQHVTCHTRKNVTLDLFYSNVKDAYTSVQLARPGPVDRRRD